MNITNSIYKRLAALQRAADENKPAQVVVTFTSGNTIVTDSAGAIDLFQRIGPSGGLQTLHSDHPAFGPWARLLTGLLRPVPNREVSDFE